MRIEADQQYIVNLTYQLMGRKFVHDMVTNGPFWMDTYYAAFGRDLRAKFERMSNAKLGHICGFGHPYGHSEPIRGSKGFIRMTGIEEVFGFNLANARSGREVLIRTAIATILSILLDMVKQPQYEALRKGTPTC